MQSSKQCGQGKIRNPNSGRCILQNGATARRLPQRQRKLNTSSSLSPYANNENYVSNQPSAKTSVFGQVNLGNGQATEVFSIMRYISETTGKVVIYTDMKFQDLTWYIYLFNNIEEASSLIIEKSLQAKKLLDRLESIMESEGCPIFETGVLAINAYIKPKKAIEPLLLVLDTSYSSEAHERIQNEVREIICPSRF